MSVLITSPSETLAKIRWHEQYVSEGLNKKLNGIIPAGVVRGGRLVENLAVDLTVKILADTLKGDSIYSFIDANGHQITFRQVGDVVLDLTPAASTTVFIGLLVTFAVSSATTVQWRAYSQAEIDADPTIVVLGKVVVPAAGAIPAANITPTERRDAWYDDSSGMRPWHQIVRNGSFEVAPAGVLTNDDEDEFPGWRNVGVSATAVELSIDTTRYLTGRRSLKVHANGNTSYTYLFQEATFACRPGDRIRASMWVAGDAVSAGGFGDLCVYLSYFTHEALALSTAILCQAGAEDGIFDFTEFDEITEVPAGAYFVRVAIRARNASGAATGDYYVDDVRVWTEAGRAASDDTMGRNLVGQVPPLSSLDVMPRGLSTTDMADWVSKLLRLRFDALSPPVYEYEWKHRNGMLPWLLKMIGGGLQVGRAIEGLGANIIGSAADGIIPRIKSPIPVAATARYVLLWEVDNPGAYKMRVYATDSNNTGRYTGPALVITTNAYWTGTQWNVDTVGWESLRIDFASVDIHLFYRDPLAGPFTDAQWHGTNSLEVLTAGRGGFGAGEVDIRADMIDLLSASHVYWVKEGNLIVIPGDCFAFGADVATPPVPMWTPGTAGSFKLYTRDANPVTFAPLGIIPDGATIDEIRVWVYQTTLGASEHFDVELRRVLLPNGSGVAPTDSLVQAIAGTSATGHREIKATGIAHTVAKSMTGSMYAYYLLVWGPVNYNAGDYLSGALVKYTASELWM